MPFPSISCSSNSFLEASFPLSMTPEGFYNGIMAFQNSWKAHERWSKAMFLQMWCASESQCFSTPMRLLWNHSENSGSGDLLGGSDSSVFPNLTGNSEVEMLKATALGYMLLCRQNQPELLGSKLKRDFHGKLAFNRVSHYHFVFSRSSVIVIIISVFVAVQSVSRVWLFATSCSATCQASLSFIISWSLLKLMSIELVISSNHLILCCPLLLLP